VGQVRQEGADLGFLYAPVDDPAVGIEPILLTAMVCVLPQDHPLATATEIGPAELADAQVILLDPLNTPGLHLHWQLDEVGVRLKRVMETNPSFAALGLVRAGVRTRWRRRRRRRRDR
jgi:DNA-binding transcriptional LysR family regulator